MALLFHNFVFYTSEFGLPSLHMCEMIKCFLRIIHILHSVYSSDLVLPEIREGATVHFSQYLT